MSGRPYIRDAAESIRAAQASVASARRAYDTGCHAHSGNACPVTRSGDIPLSCAYAIAGLRGAYERAEDYLRMMMEDVAAIPTDLAHEYEAQCERDIAAAAESCYGESAWLEGRA